MQGGNGVTRTVYLSLGSNLGDRRTNLLKAIELLRETITVSECSSLYETEPVGVTEQPGFYNIAVRGETELGARELLRVVKEVEHEVGRRPTFRWGPRVVDVDILMLGDELVDEPDLGVPHREMANRSFVLTPLAELAPSVTPAGMHKTVLQLLAETTDQRAVRRIEL
jgi:2-amino-4-hydroxy-6-hydroxymethyldihydropteridine diphosphokinase